MMKDLLIAIFGGTGDLSYRKLIPALYNLHVRGELDESVVILALGRRDWTREDYIEEVKPWVEEHARLDFTEACFEAFARHIDYYRMEFTIPEDYLGLFSYFDERAAEAEHRRDYIFYYAVSPHFFDIITQGLTETGCIQSNCKVIIEKPFGDDLENAREIADTLQEAFGDGNVYHIDHYLGKEMVQNISTLRFTNEIFRGAWNQRHIDNVQISAFETVGMEGRGGYYDQNGALKDMVQNHLFQILTIVAMEEPSDMADDASINRAQTRIIEDLHPIQEGNIEETIVLGQYEGYREEEDVAEDSTTETYAALVLEVENERWRGVPFFIRTGKCLDRRETVLVINFKPTHEDDPGNRLIFRIQPEEGVSLYFNIRQSGEDEALDQVSMDFLQKNRPSWQNSPEAYERLLMACYEGEQGLFSPWSMISASWSFVNRLLDAWEACDQKVVTYEPGSVGPEEAEELPRRFGFTWTDTRLSDAEDESGHDADEPTDEDDGEQESGHEKSPTDDPHESADQENAD